MKKPKLLPCPFCGRRPSFRQTYHGHITVSCRNLRCGVSPQTTPCTERGEIRGMEGAAEAWNRRPTK
jgi:hypothetical protein